MMTFLGWVWILGAWTLIVAGCRVSGRELAERNEGEE